MLELSRTMRRFVPLVLVAAALVANAATPALLHAQTSKAAISGVVLDPDGKVVVESAIVVRNEMTGETHVTVTDGSGHFVVSGLQPGLYTLEVSVPGFEIIRRTAVRVTDVTPEDITVRLSIANITETVTVSTALPGAAVAAPSQASLTARSAQSLISEQYIRNYTSPVSDYAQVLQMAPGTFSVAANGAGLGDTKTSFRGFQDGYYNITFDGIPWGDTNNPTHHSWVFFPATTIGSTVFDRSPGSAATVGPATFGGSVNLLSRSLPSQQQIGASVSYGSFNTRMFDGQLDTGRFGAGGKQRLLIEGHQMQSDGYQTFNFQKRDAFQAKYQYTVSDNTVVTAFSSIMHLDSNTPNQKGSTRAQYQQNGDNFLMTDSPTSPLNYKFNFYSIPTNFEYVGVRTNLGRGWSMDDKVYTMRYYNKQNYNSTTAISTTSATDKLNSYWKFGNLLPVTHVSNSGIFRTGLWSEFASTDRYQIPADPRTWVDAALPNFHEQFGTTTLQPYAEYEMKAASNLTITPGIKLAYYKQDFTQFADNGKTVGSLNGAASVQHAVEYHSVLPSIDVHYLAQPYWSLYGQYGKGQSIPPTSIFDVKGANVLINPKPTLTDTVQFGSVWKSSRATFDIDFYHINFQNDYSSSIDPATGETIWFLGADSTTRGVEIESTILVGGGLAVYVNGTAGTAKYNDSKLWVQNTPKDTETIGLTYNVGSWNVGLFSKHVGDMFNDNTGVHEAIPIDPFNLTNLFVNYQLRGSSKFSQTRIRLAVNNLSDSHAITAVTAASAKSNLPAPGDILTLMAARSVTLSVTLGFSPKQP